MGCGTVKATFIITPLHTVTGFTAIDVIAHKENKRCVFFDCVLVYSIIRELADTLQLQNEVFV